MKLSKSILSIAILLNINFSLEAMITKDALLEAAKKLKPIEPKINIVNKTELINSEMLQETADNLNPVPTIVILAPQNEEPTLEEKLGKIRQDVNDSYILDTSAIDGDIPTNVSEYAPQVVPREVTKKSLPEMSYEQFNEFSDKVLLGNEATYIPPHMDFSQDWDDGEKDKDNRTKNSSHNPKVITTGMDRQAFKKNRDYIAAQFEANHIKTQQKPDRKIIGIDPQAFKQNRESIGSYLSAKINADSKKTLPSPKNTAQTTKPDDISTTVPQNEQPNIIEIMTQEDIEAAQAERNSQAKSELKEEDYPIFMSNHSNNYIDIYKRYSNPSILKLAESIIASNAKENIRNGLFKHLDTAQKEISKNRDESKVNRTLANIYSLASSAIPNFSSVNDYDSTPPTTINDENISTTSTTDGEIDSSLNNNNLSPEAKIPSIPEISAPPLDKADINYNKEILMAGGITIIAALTILTAIRGSKEFENVIKTQIKSNKIDLNAFKIAKLLTLKNLLFDKSAIREDVLNEMFKLISDKMFCFEKAWYLVSHWMHSLNS